MRYTPNKFSIHTVIIIIDNSTRYNKFVKQAINTRKNKNAKG